MPHEKSISGKKLDNLFSKTTVVDVLNICLWGTKNSELNLRLNSSLFSLPLVTKEYEDESLTELNS